MNPIRALVVKKDVELRVGCYQFEIHFENKIETLIINSKTEKAYFIDHAPEPSNNYFSTAWVIELLDAFKNKHNSQNFEYNFNSKSIKNRSPSFFQGIIHRSRSNSPVPPNSVDFESISKTNSHFGM